MVLGNYHDWGDDFGQYYTHARNVLWGRNWAFGMSGFPAVMPGYPLLLSGLITLFGDNFFPPAFLNSILWSGVSLLAFFVFKGRFRNPLLAYLAFLIHLFSPLAFTLQQSSLPNILESFLVMLAFLVAPTVIENKGWKSAAIFFFVLVCCGLVRTTALALYLGFFACGLIQKNLKLSVVSLGAAAVTIAIEQFVAINGHGPSNFGVFFHFLSIDGHKGEGLSLSRALDYVVYTFLRAYGYLSSMASQICSASWLGWGKQWMLTDERYIYSHPFAIPVGLFVGAVFIVDLLRRRHVDFCLFFCLYLLMISGFRDIGLDQRYVLPILPISIYYFYLGFDFLCRKGSAVWNISAVGLSLCFLGNILVADYGNRNVHRMNNFIRTPELSDFASWFHRFPVETTVLGVGFPEKLRAWYFLVDASIYQGKPIATRYLHESRLVREFLEREACYRRIFVCSETEQNRDILKVLSNVGHRPSWKNGRYVAFVKEKDPVSCSAAGLRSVKQ